MRKVIILAIMACAVMVLSGCKATYKQYNELFDNLGSTLTTLVNGDKNALEALKNSISSTENKNRITEMKTQIDTRYRDVTDGKQMEDIEKDNFLGAVCELCPIRDVQSLFACNIAGEMYHSYITEAQSKKKDYYDGTDYTESDDDDDLRIDWDHSLYILEDIGSDNIEVLYIGPNGGMYADVDCEIDYDESNLTCEVYLDDNYHDMFDDFTDCLEDRFSNIEDWQIYELYTEALGSLSNKSYNTWTDENTKYLTFGVVNDGVAYIVRDEDGKGTDASSGETGAISYPTYKIDYDKKEFTLGVRVDITSGNALHKLAVKQTEVTPVDFWDENINNELNNMLKGPIFVLKSDFYDTGETIASISNAMYNLKNGIGTEQHRAIINKTFTYIDKSGNETNTIDAGQYLDIFETKNFVATDEHWLRLNGTNEMSHINLCKIRVKHLNTKEFSFALDLTEKSEGAGSVKYWWANEGNDTTQNNVYLLAYPLSYINNIETKYENEKLSWSAGTAYSGMYLNLGTQELTYDAEGTMKTVTAKNLQDVYSFDSENCSFGQFTIVGEEGDQVPKTETRKNAISLATKKIDIKKSPVIVILDYLEGTYLPSSIHAKEYDEMYAALGRKLRVQRFNGEKPGDVFAHIVGNSGKVIGADIGSPVQVRISEVTSIEPMPKNVKDIEIKKLTFEVGNKFEGFEGNNVKTEKQLITSVVKANDDTNVDENGMIIDSKKVTKEYVKLVHTGLFGKSSLGRNNKGRHIATIDSVEAAPDTEQMKNALEASSVQKPNLFVIGIDYSIVASQLVTGWINAKDTGNGNMAWWAWWLEQNGYRYSVESEDVENALVKDYKFEMAKEGYIILDLETIATIQEIYDKEETKAEAKFIRTFSFIVGILLIAYSMLLLGAWVLDVNLSGESKGLLGKLTFGRLQAVPSDCELLDTDDEKVSYMTFAKLFTRVAVVMALGILLTMFDVLDLFYKLLGTIDSIISTIKEYVFNT